MAPDDVSLFGHFHQILAIIGLSSLTYIFLKVTTWIYHFIKVYLISPVFKLHTDVTKLGKWAAVTGSTDGIGKAYAEELASKGLNIVLLSRSKEKLDKVAKEIETNFNVQTKVVVVDFTGGPDIYNEIERELECLEIGVLVNNVGMVSPVGSRLFLDTPNIQQFIPEVINVNVAAATQMTRILLPAMVQRKKGAIINISSGSGKTPVPLKAVCSATKAYMDFFSRTLQVEYESKGIIVQSIIPYYVSTNMSGNISTSLFVPSARQYVKQALATLGLENRTHGYYTHALQGLLFDILPFFITIKLRFTWRLWKRKHAQKLKSR